MVSKVVVVLIGDVGVGKSHLFHRYVSKVPLLEPGYQTIGVDCGVQRESIQAVGTVPVVLWDMPGLDRFRPIVYSYLRMSSIVLMVYDIGNRETFLSIQRSWAAEARVYSNDQTLFVLVGTKADQRHREVRSDDASDYANREGFLFFEVSSTTGGSVDSLFLETVRQSVICRELHKVAPSPCSRACVTCTIT